MSTAVPRGRFGRAVGRVVRPWVAAVAASILLLSPLLVAGIPPGRIEYGYPRVFRGDEPHYVVILTSLLRDGDLDLTNNYENVRKGGDDAGELWKGARNFDNHTAAVYDGQRRVWAAVYDFVGTPAERWAEDAGGRVVPPVKAGQVPFPPGVRQYSVHQPGIGFLLYPFLLPLRDSHRIESGALAGVAVGVVAGFWLFRWLCLGLGAGPWRATGVAAAAFLATPVWFYARTLFVEGFTLLFLVAAYAVYLRRGWAVAAGVLLAASLHFKAYLAVLAVPIAVDLLARREWRRLVAYSAAVGLGVASVMALNWAYFGSPLTPAQPFDVGSFRQGGFGQLLDTQFGLLVVCPAAVVAAVAWPHFLRTRPREAALLLTPVLLLYLTISFYSGWQGLCYGPRYLVPVIPFLFAALAGPRPDPVSRRVLGPQLSAVLVAASAAMSAFAAFDHWWVWMRNPALELALYLHVPPP